MLCGLLEVTAELRDNVYKPGISLSLPSPPPSLSLNVRSRACDIIERFFKPNLPYIHFVSVALESCPLGTEWSEQNHACVTCSFGYHTTSRPVCEKCPDTFTTARRGATSIDKCQLKFSSSVEAPYFFGGM